VGSLLCGLHMYVRIVLEKVEGGGLEMGVACRVFSDAALFWGACGACLILSLEDV
jgi:hypothetical protein